MKGAKVVGAIGLILGLAVPNSTQASDIQLGGSVVTDYVWRGASVLSKGPAFQPSLTVPLLDTSLSANAWMSFALTDRGTFKSSDELDITLSYATEYNDVGINAGVIHYSFFQNDGWPNSVTTTNEAFVSLTGLKAAFSPTISAYYDWNENGGNGYYLNGSVSYSADASGTPVAMGASVGYMDQAWITTPGISDVNFSLGTAFKYGNVNFAPSVNLTLVPNADLNPDFASVWVGLGAAMAN